MTALATAEQLAARMRSELPDDDDTVAAALDDASATVRSYTGQQFDRAETTDRLRVVNGAVTLPQRPVWEVSSVTDPAENAVAYLWDGLERVTLTLLSDWAYTSDLAVAGAVDVTYDHGYDDIPGDIVAVVCNIAARALASPPETSAVTSHSITNFSESFGPVGAAGPLGVFSDERRVLDRYRRDFGVTWQP